MIIFFKTIRSFESVNIGNKSFGVTNGHELKDDNYIIVE